MPKNFHKWLEEQKIELSTLQEKAAVKYLKQILKFRSDNKATFLERIIDRFISQHGFSFSVTPLKKEKAVKVK
jgi:uncharacterized protein YneR